MRKKVNGKTILKRLREADDRAKVSLYLSKKVFNDFKEACSDVSASKVMEELMTEFIISCKG